MVFKIKVAAVGQNLDKKVKILDIKEPSECSSLNRVLRLGGCMDIEASSYQKAA